MVAAYNALGAEALAHCTIEAIVSVLITQLASEDRDKPVHATKVRATKNRAMVCPPKPWTGPRDGGYLLGDDLRFDTTRMIRAIAPVRDVIESDLATDNALKSAESVFAALNVLQATPYAISETVHDIAKQAAASGLNLDDLPAKYRLERVPKQRPTGDSEEDRRGISNGDASRRKSRTATRGTNQRCSGRNRSW